MFLTLFSFTFLEHCCQPTADFLAIFDVCVCDRVVLAVEWYVILKIWVKNIAKKRKHHF